MRIPAADAERQPVVALYREMLLNYNEPFIRSHAEAMTHYQAFYLGMRRVNGLELPADRTLVLNPGTSMGAIAEAGFKLFGLSTPSFLNAIRQTRPSVLHAITGVSGAQALPLARSLGTPLLVSCTGYEATASRQELAQYRYRGRVYLRRLNALKRETTMFLAVSEFVRRRLLERGFPESKTVVHYFGTDTAFFAPDPELPREPLVLFVGRLIPVKGVAHLIRAMAFVQRQVAQSELVIIGRGGLRAELERLAADLRVRVRFVGSQTPEEVRAWMNRALVMATPSVPAPDGTVEALSATCIEAQSMGLPVCAFASGGVPESVADGETGLLAREGDETALASNIARLLTDPPLWRRFSLAAQTRARQHFDIRRQARGLETLYDQARNLVDRRT